MRVLVLGGDGYLGWPTAMFLSKKGHDVTVFDNFVKKKLKTSKMCDRYFHRLL